MRGRVTQGASPKKSLFTEIPTVGLSKTRRAGRRQFLRVPISGEAVLKGRYESVASLFRSPERLWRLTPGCKRVERIASDTYRGWMRFGIPGIMGSYIGVLKLNYHSTNRYGMRVKASRADGTGSINAMGTIRLVKLDHDSILLRYRGGVKYRGLGVLLGRVASQASRDFCSGSFLPRRRQSSKPKDLERSCVTACSATFAVTSRAQFRQANDRLVRGAECKESSGRAVSNPRRGGNWDSTDS